MMVVCLIVPPLLMLAISSRIRALIWSVMCIWILMVAGGQYHLAYTPGYDSIAPGFSILFGWFPGLIYSAIWLAVFFACSCLRETPEHR